MPLALRAMAEPAEAIRWMLLGTDKGKGIYRASWNAASGEMGPVELAIATERPAYFAMHPKKPVLYAANELSAGDGKVSSFRVEGKTGGLEAMQQVSSAGAGPCYVSVDETGETAFVACYAGGTVSAIALKKDGELTVAGGGLDCRKNEACGATGPVKDRQDAAHLHCAVVAPDNKYLLVCNLGEDAIEVIPIKTGRGHGMSRSIPTSGGCTASMSWTARSICSTSIRGS
jgi:6-phosphogluconolactonase